MINHIDLGPTPFARFRTLQTLIVEGTIALGGYRKNKIYGMLSCASGKRMKTENRVYFKNEQEAIAAGYRPCGNCMPVQYKQWKHNGTIQYR
jgi:methylphosphotriester-DNA--protein-cysteine methyltransferase